MNHQIFSDGICVCVVVQDGHVFECHHLLIAVEMSNKESIKVKSKIERPGFLFAFRRRRFGRDSISFSSSLAVLEFVERQKGNEINPKKS